MSTDSGSNPQSPSSATHLSGPPQGQPSAPETAPDLGAGQPTPAPENPWGLPPASQPSAPTQDQWQTTAPASQPSASNPQAAWQPSTPSSQPSAPPAQDQWQTAAPASQPSAPTPQQPPAPQQPAPQQQWQPQPPAGQQSASPQGGYAPGQYQPGAQQYGYAPQPAGQYQPQGYPGQPAPYGQQPGQPAPLAPKPPKVRKINDANPFAALLDFNFSSFATPGLVKIVYLLAVVLGVLAWLGYIVGGFASGDVADTGPLLGILAIILGWIPLLLWIFVVRIGLELAIAVVRTSEDMRHIRAQSSEDSSND